MSIHGNVIFRRSPPLEISKDFANEIQGTKEQVNFILQRALEEENATLVDVGGVQGVVN